MRAEFRADLAEVSHMLVNMADRVRTAMREATTALLRADLTAAEQVIAADAEVDAVYRQVEERVCQLLAQQSPVAGDLRLLVTALHVAGDLERMGDLAEHVAKTGLRRHPAPAVPPKLSGMIINMSGVADRMAAKISQLLATPDATLAAELERDDDAMDDLERHLYETLLGPDWEYGVEAAVDAALLGRFYERYADHAVNAGEQVAYLVTGEMQSS